jgi:hypothetical protein
MKNTNSSSNNLRSKEVLDRSLEQRGDVRDNSDTLQEAKALGKLQKMTSIVASSAILNV